MMLMTFDEGCTAYKYTKTNELIPEYWSAACVYCGKEFDSRVVIEHFKYCPECGRKIVRVFKRGEATLDD